MTTNAPTDVQALLEPISAEAPSGLSLRYEGTYDRIREARREDDPSLPMGEWETKLKVADWNLVERLCREALLKKSKDLQLATWLAEAWLKRYRVQGLTSGLSLIAQLVDRYYEQGLHPALGEDDDASSRMALVEWIDDVFTDRVRTMALGSNPDGQGFSLLDWEGAGQTVAADPEGQTATRPSHEALLAKVSLGGTTRWTDVANDAAASIVAAQSVEQAFAAHVKQPPTLRRLRETLATIEQLARNAAQTSGEAAPAPAADEPAGATDDVAMFGASAVTSSSGPIKSRADAYYRLAEAAEYLMRTEPHSPVPYLVKRAVQWGNMSLAQLLHEFIGNPEDLVTIQRLLGMRNRDET